MNVIFNYLNVIDCDYVCVFVFQVVCVRVKCGVYLNPMLRNLLFFYPCVVFVQAKMGRTKSMLAFYSN